MGVTLLIHGIRCREVEGENRAEREEVSGRKRSETSFFYHLRRKYGRIKRGEEENLAVWGVKKEEEETKKWNEMKKKENAYSEYELNGIYVILIY